MAEDKKLDSLLERVYQDGVEKSNKKANQNRKKSLKKPKEKRKN